MLTHRLRPLSVTVGRNTIGLSSFEGFFRHLANNVVEMWALVPSSLTMRDKIARAQLLPLEWGAP